MTDTQRTAVREYRARGMSYAAIADALGLSKATVTTFCQRNDLAGRRGAAARDDSVCPQCGKKVVQIPGRKHRRFCSPACRQIWWNGNLALVQHKSSRTVRCAHCGEEFEVFGSNVQKYCSHKCYIADRFHGGKAT